VEFLIDKRKLDDNSYDDPSSVAIVLRELNAVICCADKLLAPVFAQMNHSIDYLIRAKIKEVTHGNVSNEHSFFGSMATIVKLPRRCYKIACCPYGVEILHSQLCHNDEKLDETDDTAYADMPELEVVLPTENKEEEADAESETDEVDLERIYNLAASMEQLAVQNGVALQ
jgi:hypothetical protein